MGPQPNTSQLEEDYANSPTGKRVVQYFDKSWMEINNPATDKSSQYYVTNGLLVQELVIGRLQLGDAKFETRQPYWQCDYYYLLLNYAQAMVQN